MKTNNNKTLTALVIINLALLSLGFTSVQWDNLFNDEMAETPIELDNALTYQGRITTPTGGDIQDGTYSFKFNFYPLEDSQEQICYWRSDSVWVKSGNFRVVMGKGDGTGTCENDLAFSRVLADNPEVWMEMEVGADSSSLEILNNRVNIGGTPRSLHSQISEVSKYAMNGVPVGTVVAFMGNEDAPPAGWIPADGRAIDSSINPEYSALVDHLRGLGNEAVFASDCSSSSCANVPDLRRMFLKGKDFGADAIENLKPGDYQVDSTKMPNIAFATINNGSHGHSGSTSTDGTHYHNLMGNGNGADTWPTLYTSGGGHAVGFWPYHGDQGYVGSSAAGQIIQSSGSHYHSITADAAGEHSHSISGGDSETRPKSITVLYIIKY